MNEVAHQRQYVAASTSITQLRQQAAPHSRQADCREGWSSVIPHSHVVVMMNSFQYRSNEPPARTAAVPSSARAQLAQ